MAVSAPVARPMECLIQVHLLWPEEPAPAWIVRIEKDLALKTPVSGLGGRHQAPRVARVEAPAPFKGLCTQIEGVVCCHDGKADIQDRWLSKKMDTWLDRWRAADPQAVFWVRAALAGPNIASYQAIMAGSGIALPHPTDSEISAWTQFFDDESLRRAGWDTDLSPRPPQANALEVVRDLTLAGGLGPLLQRASRHLQARRLNRLLPQVADATFVRL